MELKHLRTLQAVVDQGSFQRAAEHLGYTQSTVTVQIQQLEASIGVPLFQKAGRRMVLTETGMAILPQVRAVPVQSKFHPGRSEPGSLDVGRDHRHRDTSSQWSVVAVLGSHGTGDLFS